MEGYCRGGNAQLGPEKQGKTGGDHFIVEELLDFSNEEEGDTEMAAEEDGGSEETGGNCSADSCDNSFSGGGGGGGSHTSIADELVCRSIADNGLSGDLCEPYEELAELEWLSKFVEDSFSSEELPKQQLNSGLKSTSCPPTSIFPTAKAAADEPRPFSAELPVPGKARSKRARTAPCSWSSRFLLLSQSSAKKNPSPESRKCLHCAADKTPQWRTGPMGPKTLCNACGVRFKSGRLVPEYRPAASPTFVLSKHSNSHRKVVELRRQKEIQDHQPQQQFLPAAVAGDEFLIQRRLREDFRLVL